MTYQERNNLVAIFNNLIVSGYFAWRIYGMYLEGAFDGPDGLTIWAQTVLWVIPVSIIASIILTIVFNILFAIAARDPNPEMVSDERDRQFGARSIVTAVIVASAGFILALVVLALGLDGFYALNLILVGFVLADLIGSLVKLVSYRRGY